MIPSWQELAKKNVQNDQISNFNIKWVAYIYEVLKQKPKPITYVRNAKQNVM